MQANARYSNVLRSLLVALSEAGLSAPIVPADDDRFDSKANDQFVRVTVLFGDERAAGRLDEKWNTEVPITIQADCYARGTAGEAVGPFDLAEQLADEAQAFLRNKTLSVKDYVGSAGPTETIAWLQLGHSRRQTLPGEEGFQRRTVETPGFWFLQRGE